MTGRGNKGRARAGAAVLVALILAVAVPAASAADAGSPSGACDSHRPRRLPAALPNDYFTVPDASTPTGRRLDLDPSSMPRNRAGKPIDPTDMNRADGFSPGKPIITRVPGLDGTRRSSARAPFPSPTWRATPTATSRSSSSTRPPAAPSRLVGDRQHGDQRGERQPDHPPRGQLPRGPPLHRRPAQPAPRRRPIDPAAVGFRVYRDRLEHRPAGRRGAPRATWRRCSRRSRAPGSTARDLYLAWDFTVASSQSLDRAGCWRSATTPSPSSGTPTWPT